ncbi:uncharacterized protein LOC107717148 [Sinocyclocheilus rhinocerous]|uniref:uncharacterized protein LOC107717148 n=1 Tax=Sinocyclocheilus rhinocerous TaxID=307959 RepID=UPI0007B7B4C6|nr:PREDICTED: uncharacterized protein LOC107717148 [Sinocyclocheilus rhinocerous]
MMDDEIQWIFEYKNTLIDINVTADSMTVFDDVLDGRFRDRLKLNKQTGSLTITNTRPEHTGKYQLETNSMREVFNLQVYDEISMKEGDSVTLNSGLTEIMDDDQIQWWFGIPGVVIVEINKWSDSMTVYEDVLDGRFRDRLKLDNQTGSLTVINFTAEHSGIYRVDINRMVITFILAVYDEISVKEGDSVTLNSGLTEIRDVFLIHWVFGDEITLIADISKQDNSFTVYEDVLDGRFRDRLELDNQTGSLTITNITTEDSGLFQSMTLSTVVVLLKL